MSVIAKALQVSTSAATGLVDRMVRSGFLRRFPDDDDRRIINIELTQKGRKITDDIQRRRRALIEEIFGRLKPAERERFLGMMKKIYNILSEGQK